MAGPGAGCGDSEGERCAASPIYYAWISSNIFLLIGALKSPLDGKLVAIKDNICTRDMRTTCASRILETYTSPFNATVVESLEKAGAIVAGKTNLDEFGMG